MPTADEMRRAMADAGAQDDLAAIQNFALQNSQQPPPMLARPPEPAQAHATPDGPIAPYARMNPLEQLAAGSAPMPSIAQRVASFNQVPPASGVQAQAPIGFSMAPAPQPPSAPQPAMGGGGAGGGGGAAPAMPGSTWGGQLQSDMNQAQALGEHGQQLITQGQLAGNAQESFANEQKAKHADLRQLWLNAEERKNEIERMPAESKVREAEAQLKDMPSSIQEKFSRGSTGQKILMVIGAALGGAAKGLGGGRSNTFLDAMQSAVSGEREGAREYLNMTQQSLARLTGKQKEKAIAELEHYKLGTEAAQAHLDAAMAKTKDPIIQGNGMKVASDLIKDRVSTDAKMAALKPVKGGGGGGGGAAASGPLSRSDEMAIRGVAKEDAGEAEATHGLNELERQFTSHPDAFGSLQNAGYAKSPSLYKLFRGEENTQAQQAFTLARQDAERALGGVRGLNPNEATQISAGISSAGSPEELRYWVNYARGKIEAAHAERHAALSDKAADAYEQRRQREGAGQSQSQAPQPAPLPSFRRAGQ